MTRLYSGIAGWIDRLFNQYELVRRVTIFWAVGLITHAHFLVYSYPSEDVTNQIVALYTATVGLFGTAITIYFNQRGAQDKRDDKKNERAENSRQLPSGRLEGKTNIKLR